MNEFKSIRLYEARTYRKKTMDELAEQVGVKKQAISQFENDKANPDFETIQKISTALQFPAGFFYEQTQPEKIGNTYFRALFSSNKRDMNSQRIKTKYLAYIHDSLARYIDFPKLNLPTIDNSIGIEKAAQQVRDYWGLGQEPITDMIAILEKNGIIVSEFATDSKKIDAFYQYGEIKGREYYCVVIGTEKHSFVRRQFSCAHELAHMLFHEKYEDLDEISREEFHHREAEANDFASAFLLPKDTFIRDLQCYGNRLNRYIELKRKWNVSISAMVMRAYSLNVINSNQYQYMMRQISKNGWRTEEPLDNYLVIKSPKALKQAVNLIVLNNVLSGQQILELFASDGISLPKDVIDDILSLDPDTLADNTDHKIIQFSQLKNKQTKDTVTPQSKGGEHNGN